MVLYYTVALMAALLFFLGAVFWFSTNVAFAVTLGSGIWWFALLMMILLTILVFWTAFTPRYNFWVRVTVVLGSVGIIAALVVLGIQYKPFDASNIEFKLGALFDDDNGLEHINFSDLPPARPEVELGRYVPPVTNQGSCGCCWAVAAAGVLSSRINLRDGRTRSNASRARGCTGSEDDMWRVSSQTLLDADQVNSDGLGKCNAAPFPEGFTLARDFGFLASTCVPFYAGAEPNCQTWCGSPKVATTRNGRSIQACMVKATAPYVWNRCSAAGGVATRGKASSAYLLNNEEAMKREISAHGPIMCTVNFYTKSDGNRAIWTLSGKSTGVYVSAGFVAKPSMDGNEYRLDFREGGHTMIIFGYGVAGDGTPYWDVQNSWGTNWGRDGRLKIQRGVNAWNIERYCAAGRV